MKTCSTCKQPRPLSEFSKNVAKPDGFHNQCKGCQKTQQALWYQTHKVQHKANANVWNKRRWKENRKKLQSYLLTHPCVDCGNPNPIVLEFDHVRGKKRMAIAKMLALKFSWNTILEEISKCEVRCANCHRIVTHNRRLGNSIGLE